MLGLTKIDWNNSARVAGLAQADGLAILPACAAQFDADDEVTFLPFDA